MLAKKNGFTLIETLAAIAISAMLLAALASYAMAFMQTSREGEVMHRLQRELVFSLEALESEMRIAQTVTPDGANWLITQVTYDGTWGTRTIPVTHDPATLTLSLGARVLSRSVAVFSITPDPDIAGRLLLHVETIESLPMIKSGNLPLKLDTEVVMRNHGFVEPGEEPEDPGDPEDPPQPDPLAINSITPAPGGDIAIVRVGSDRYASISCSTSIDAICRLEWAVGAGPYAQLGPTQLGRAHSWNLIGPLSNNVQLNVRITADDPLLQPDVTTGVLTYTTRNN